jgi:hypothetical protein
MANKPSSQSKKYRVVFEVAFDASDRASALARAKELVDVPNAKLVRVQESSVAWLSITDPDAKA